MKRIFIIFFFACILSGCIAEEYKGSEVMVGDKLPEFSVQMNDGTIIDGLSLKGNISFVMFFHPSCPDCRQALPEVQRIYNEYLSRGVVFALISRECGSDEIEAYWDEKGFNIPYSAQTDKTVYNMFASSRIPRIYISDEKGTVRYIFTDDPVASYDDLKSSVESLIR